MSSASDNYTNDNNGNNEDGSNGWCTIESDPGVFTELIRELGVKGVQVEELYGLDESFAAELDPIYGFIFLFKWDPKIESTKRKKIVDDDACSLSSKSEPFFARQVIQNACATQAILSILMNIPSGEPLVELGPDLLNFKDFCTGLSPELVGEAIGSSDLLIKVHNSFNRPELALIEGKERKSGEGREEDPFHFVSIMPVNNVLYEFDGLQSAPIVHGKVKEDGGDNWLRMALKVINEKIAAFQSLGPRQEIRFNLMAIIKDRSLLYREQLESNNKMISDLEANGDPTNLVATLMNQNIELESRLGEECIKEEQWSRENARRRHNFIPLAVALLREMANAGHFDEFIIN